MTTAITIPKLSTARLRLEPLTAEHSPGMHTLWSDADVCRYSGHVTDYDRNPIEMPARTVSDSDLIIEFWRRAAQDGWGFRWAVLVAGVDSHAFVGTVGFNSIGQRSEIAYHLIPAYWGLGYMNEAAVAAIDWCMQTTRAQAPPHMREIEAFIEPANQPSIALAERLGMVATDYMNEGARRYLRRQDKLDR